MSHQKIHEDIVEILKDATPVDPLKDKKTDGLLVFSIHLNKKKANSKVFISGMTLEQADVIIRDIYSSVFELRKRNDPKMKALDRKVQKMKGIDTSIQDAIIEK